MVNLVKLGNYKPWLPSLNRFTAFGILKVRIIQTFSSHFYVYREMR